MSKLPVNRAGARIGNERHPSSLQSAHEAIQPLPLRGGLGTQPGSSGSYAADDLPEGALRITTDELIWKPGRVPGHEIAALIGDSTKPGPYVERVKFPANSISQAHSHPEARAYTIISGTWYVGYGDKFDPAKLKALPAGSFYTEPANVNHFSQIKDDGVVVQIAGVGADGHPLLRSGERPQKVARAH